VFPTIKATELSLEKMIDADRKAVMNKLSTVDIKLRGDIETNRLKIAVNYQDVQARIVAISNKYRQSMGRLDEFVCVT
jgi:hypothetical protein